MLWVLMGAIGAVLLIACANIANLMLVRADARRPEFAVRAALGAMPGRIARELLVESLVLGAAGSVVGLLLAYAGLRALVAIGPSDLPRLQEIAVYPPVLAFSVAISLASALVFGSITALKHALQRETALDGRCARIEREPRAECDAQHAGGRAGRAGSRAGRERGADDSHVASAARRRSRFCGSGDDSNGEDLDSGQRIGRPGANHPHPARDARQHRGTSRCRGQPASRVTFRWTRRNSNGPIAVEGQTVAPGETLPVRRWIRVSPGYFGAMGTRLIAGRDVTWNDIETGGRVALISEDFARELAAEPAGAIGKRVRPGPFVDDAWREVIGVVQSVQQDGLSGRHPVPCTSPCSRRTCSTCPSLEPRRSRSRSAARARAPPASWRRFGRRCSP